MVTFLLNNLGYFAIEITVVYAYGYSETKGVGIYDDQINDPML